MKKVGIFVGSLRKASYSKKVAEAAAVHLKEIYDVEFINIGDLNIYNQDLEGNEQTPNSWLKFRDEVKELDALLFVTPEYNRSVPAGLKNALDVGSRPPVHSVWDGKPGAIISVSPGALGGFGSSNHFRQSMTCLNILLMPTPEMYLAKIKSSMDEDGKLDERTDNFIKSFVTSFDSWIQKVE